MDSCDRQLRKYVQDALDIVVENENDGHRKISILLSKFDLNHLKYLIYKTDYSITTIATEKVSLDHLGLQPDDKKLTILLENNYGPNNCLFDCVIDSGILLDVKNDKDGQR